MVVMFGLVEGGAEISRVSIGNSSKPVVLISNSPVVLASEHSERSPRNLEAALLRAFGIDDVRDVHGYPSVLPVEAAA